MAVCIENIKTPVAEPIESLEPSDLEVYLKLYLLQLSARPTVFSESRLLYRWPRLGKSRFESGAND